MTTRERDGGGESASRVGDWDLDLGGSWDWRSIPQFLSSFCLFLCTGGCFGCCDKSTPLRQAGQLSKGLNIQDQNPGMAELFWSTSTIEMEQSGQMSIYTFNASTQSLDDHLGVGSSHNPHEFVNHGLVLWKQTRQKWIENRTPKPKLKELHEPTLSWNATYENMLGSNKSFPRPIPLPDMIDFLVDIWEQEGLYD